MKEEFYRSLDSGREMKVKANGVNYAASHMPNTRRCLTLRLKLDWEGNSCCGGTFASKDPQLVGLVAVR